MRLYHGTNYSSAIDICMNGIDLSRSQKYLDFGAGFYTTPSYEHAAITAIRKTDKFNAATKANEEPYIVELKYLPPHDFQLKIAQYPRHCEKWGEFVLNNRLTAELLTFYHIKNHNQDFKYDVCIGEITDGQIINMAYQVNRHILLPSEVNFHRFLKDNGNVYPLQYSFHTLESISCISELSCDKIDNKDKYIKLIAKGKQVGTV